MIVHGPNLILIFQFFIFVSLFTNNKTMEIEDNSNVYMDNNNMDNISFLQKLFPYNLDNTKILPQLHYSTFCYIIVIEIMQLTIQVKEINTSYNIYYIVYIFYLKFIFIIIFINII